MPLVHFKNDIPAEAVSEALRSKGYAIVDELLPAKTVDRFLEEMKPYIDAASFGNTRSGLRTKRTGAAVSRSAIARELVMHPLALAVATAVIDKASTYRLHLTQVMSVYPGEPAQQLHQDEAVWDFFPFPANHHVECSVIWAMSDFTEEMGATRIVPESQYGGPGKVYADSETEPAVMVRGSALFYTGKIYHGAGQNRSETIRQAFLMSYAAGWLAQEENQFLSTPLEVARTLPDNLLRLIGYRKTSFALNSYRDTEDPLNAVRMLRTDEVVSRACIC